MAMRRVARRVTKLTPARVPSRGSKTVTEQDAILALHYVQAYARLAMEWILKNQRAPMLRSSGGGGAATEEDVIYIARLTKNCPPPVPLSGHGKKPK